MLGSPPIEPLDGDLSQTTARANVSRSSSRNVSRSRSRSGSASDTANSNRKARKVGEFQVVILAGAGSGFTTLANEYPKALVPIINRPLLTYQLALLEKSGFSEVIMVADGFDDSVGMEQAIEEFVTEYNAKGNLQVRVGKNSKKHAFSKNTHAIVTTLIKFASCSDCFEDHPRGTWDSRSSACYCTFDYHGFHGDALRFSIGMSFKCVFE